MKKQRIVTCANEKGGVGKTTVAVNLATSLCELGRRVLLVDTDPTAAASVWLGVRGTGEALRAVFRQEAALDDAIQGSSIEGLDLVPSGEGMLGLDGDREAVGRGAQFALKKGLQGAQVLGPRWDWVIIDCPPGSTLITVAALCAAREVLVPTEASMIAIEGLARLQRDLDGVRRMMNRELRPETLVAVRVDRRTGHQVAMVDHLREIFGEHMLDVEIRINTKLQEAFSFRKPINQYAPNSVAAQEFRMLATELETRGEGAEKPGDVVDFPAVASGGQG